MLPETLEKIHSLITQGAIVIGTPPAEIATLSGGREAEQQFKIAVNTLWGKGTAPVRSIGKGRLYRDDLLAALQQEHITPDVQVSDTAVHWLHRQTADADIYFFSLNQGKAFRGPITFRSEGYAEIWDPLTGSTKALGSNKRSAGDSISVDLDAGSSQFVVFRKEPHKLAEPVKKLITETALNKGWEVSFPQGWGFSSPVRIDSLAPWFTFGTNPESQHFSGTATYKRQLTIHPQPRAAYILDLGEVEAIAKVNINGKEVDTKWTYPYRVDISSYLKEGNNELQISVTSTWFNRLVYDAGLPEDQRKTWTINGPDKGSALKKYGLLGPVMLRQY
ncbi:alpha-L-rhamnosidase [bacterium A37T11]|nr:alpha-L-rhamnosidase [bacterium A37T11]